MSLFKASYSWGAGLWAGSFPQTAVGQLEGRQKILYVIRPCRGGMLQHLLGLLRYLDRGRFCPVVAGPPVGPLPAAVAALDVAFIPLALQEGWHPWPDHWLRRRLAAIIAGTGVDLVHTHGVQAGLAARPVAYAAGVPVVATAHNFVYSRPGPAWQKRILARCQRRLVGYTDCFIAVCEGLGRELRQVEGVPAHKLVIIPNGVDLDRLQAIFARGKAKDPLFPHERPRIGVFARLIPEKGVDVFLRASVPVAREVPRCRFLIVGDGPQRRALENLARRLGLAERAFFLGEVEEAAGLLPLLDLYVQPSRQEGLSLAVLEAMAAGRPVVASRTGGLVEEVRHGETGWLTAPGDVHDLAKAMLFLLGHAELARRFGENGRRLVAERFTVKKMVEATEAVYSRLLATGRAGRCSTTP